MFRRLFALAFVVAPLCLITSCAKTDHTSDAIHLSTNLSFSVADDSLWAPELYGPKYAPGAVYAVPKTYALYPPFFIDSQKDTVAFEFTLPKRDSTVSLVVYHNNGDVISTVLRDVRLNAAGYAYLWKNPKSDVVYGVQFTAAGGQFSKEYWFFSE